MSPLTPLKYGILGRSIAYSQSPHLFNGWFQKHHLAALFEVIDRASLSKEELEEHIAPIYQGICVTIPYKKAVYDRLTSPHEQSASPLLYVDESSLQTSCCNMVHFEADKISLYNTDLLAFKKLLEAFAQQHSDVESFHITLIGAGGAAAASYGALQDIFAFKRCTLDIVSRNTPNHFQPLSSSSHNSFDIAVFSFEDYLKRDLRYRQPLGYAQSKKSKQPKKNHIIIQASPLGSKREGDHPEVLEAFLHKQDKEQICLMVDWVYGENLTTCQDFANTSLAPSIPFITGPQLLKEQALLTFELWFGFRPE